MLVLPGKDTTAASSSASRASVHARCVRLADADGVSLNQWLLEAIGERLGAEGFARRLAEEARGGAAYRRVAEEKAEYGT